MDKNIFSQKQSERMKRLGSRFSIVIIVLFLLFIIGTFLFQIFTEYIWMETLQFQRVYTTILYSKITLGISGFLLFFILTLITLYFIRHSYMAHFNAVQLPVQLTKRRYAFGIMVAGATFIGVVGSLIVQGLGW